MPHIDPLGNVVHHCWRCGDEHGTHCVRCPECGAHRDMAWVKEHHEEKETNDAQLVQ